MLWFGAVCGSTQLYTAQCSLTLYNAASERNQKCVAISYYDVRMRIAAAERVGGAVAALKISVLKMRTTATEILASCSRNDT